MRRSIIVCKSSIKSCLYSGVSFNEESTLRGNENVMSTFSSSLSSIYKTARLFFYVNKMKIGIVGAGPAGLYAARKLREMGYTDIMIWEKNPFIGGRTKMRCVEGKSVVSGAGVIRSKDKRLRSIAGNLLKPFISNYHLDFEHGQVNLKTWIKRLRRDKKKMDRSVDFEKNFVRLYGRESLHEFIELVGYTDFLKADVIDTIEDYGFEDCLPGQKMFGVDWDALMKKMVVSGVELCLNSEVQKVERNKISQHFEVSVKGGKKYGVDVLIWSAPVLDKLEGVFETREEMESWKRIKKGVCCQSFLRLYGVPKKGYEEMARDRFPKHTLLRFNNPLGKVIPYGDSVYMISYADNKRADRVYSCYKKEGWLKKYSGVEWKKLSMFYFPCGTHYFSPLDPKYRSRTEFLKEAQIPIHNLFLIGEGFSRDQGWTEGAIKSFENIITFFK